jgi:hypothetical protein
MSRKSKIGLVAVGAILSAVVTAGPANAGLVLTAQGIADGFTLSTFYSDPGAYYGLLGVTTTASGQVIGASFNYGTINLLNDIDGQTHASILQSSFPGGPTPYEVATVGGATYYSGGFGGPYYQVNTTTLGLTPLSLSGSPQPLLGLWANQVTGHLISSSYSGLIDIDPITGAVHVITATTGFDGVTVSPDGKTAYAELNGNIYAYDILTGTLLQTYTGAAAHSPDGTGVISGGTFDSYIVVNNNDGTVGLIDPLTSDYTTIATGGTRGDFVGPDLTNGTLFIASADAVERLAIAGGTIGGGPSTGGNGSVPEPATIALFGAGIVGLGTMRRRRRKAKG